MYSSLFSSRNFEKMIGLSSNWATFNKKDHVPMEGTWDISSKFGTYLESINAPENEIQEILELIKPYNDKLIHKIRVERASQNLFEGSILYKTDRLDLLKKIINCPDTDVLKMVGSVSDLSRILYRDEGEINKIIHGARKLSSPTQFAFSLMVVSAQLEMSDFEATGLGQEINQQELYLLKRHISNTVNQYLRDFNYISTKGSRLFRIPAINKLLYKTIEKIHIAAAIHEGSSTLSTGAGAQALNIYKYTKYLTQGQVLTHNTIEKVLNSLYEFITDALYRGTRGIVSSMQEIQHYTDAISILNELDKKITIVETIFKKATKLNKVYAPTYQSLWYDSTYKAWNVLTQLQDLFGVDPLSFESLDDQIFDKNSKSGFFQPHHMDPASKASLALYDQILTNIDYHLTYRTMPIAQQKILKEGVRKLVQMGIDGKGSAKNGYINEKDIREVFAGQLFTVRSRKTGKMVYNVPIISEKTRFWQRNKQEIGLWDYHFSDVSFEDKLSGLNAKIDVFRKTLQNTGSRKDAYMAILAFKYGKYALPRFLNDAEKFVSYMFTPTYLRISPLFPLTFGDNRHLVITKILF